MIRMKWILLLFLTLSLTACQSEFKYLPGQMEGFDRVRLMRGSEAQNFVNKLHFNVVGTDSTQIAFYRDKEDREIVLYITYYPDLGSAEADYQKMTRKISPQNSVFVEGKYIELNGINLYHCFGMGQSHYVFRHENALIWMTVPTVGGQKLAESYLSGLS